MLKNPIHLRLEKLESWQHLTFYGVPCGEKRIQIIQVFCREQDLLIQPCIVVFSIQFGKL